MVPLNLTWIVYIVYNILSLNISSVYFIMHTKNNNTFVIFKNMVKVLKQYFLQKCNVYHF